MPSFDPTATALEGSRMSRDEFSLEQLENLLARAKGSPEEDLVPGEILPGFGPYVGVMEVREGFLILYNDDIRSTRSVTTSELVRRLESIIQELSDRL